MILLVLISSESILKGQKSFARFLYDFIGLYSWPWYSSFPLMLKCSILEGNLLKYKSNSNVKWQDILRQDAYKEVKKLDDLCGGETPHPAGKLFKTGEKRFK